MTPKNENQISVAIEVIRDKYINKCEPMAIKDCSKSFLYNIPIKTEVLYLRILITTD